MVHEFAHEVVVGEEEVGVALGEEDVEGLEADLEIESFSEDHGGR